MSKKIEAIRLKFDDKEKSSVIYSVGTDIPVWIDETFEDTYIKTCKTNRNMDTSEFTVF